MTKQQQYIEPVGFNGTPGEWRIETAQSNDECIVADIATDDILICGVYHDGRTDPTLDAALIANAKEAIRALQELADITSTIIASESLPQIARKDLQEKLKSKTLNATQVIAKSIPPTK